MIKTFYLIAHMYIWSWDLYKFKNNYVHTNYTHKVVKVVS